jgi:hypothetical protein
MVHIRYSELIIVGTVRWITVVALCDLRLDSFIKLYLALIIGVIHAINEWEVLAFPRSPILSCA